MPPVVPLRAGFASLVDDYLAARAARPLWKEFETLHSCERFECTNVRKRLSNPEEPPRFESSTSGAYLAAPADDGTYAVFPFFSASPVQLYHDGAMSEVFVYPENGGSKMPLVVTPAVFKRQDRQWFLQSRGRLES